MSEPLDYSSATPQFNWKPLRLLSIALAVAAVPMVLVGLVARRMLIRSIPPGRDLDDVGGERLQIVALIGLPFLMVMVGGVIGLVVAFAETTRQRGWGVPANLIAFAICILLVIKLMQ